ncbi:MAG: methylmalonyl Co-A mutase-associated GTPase MeaB [Candidatus Eremiobacteraeota bacterium]|nr:methylmalonyl Co-A mutase-associated GTPase MeaB [Candidatus Eremiobacteraeota bacterium]MBC5826099.1 methylmalonyl Co-A mutase-associated GTPase MeaB [Candidatus Eremiobacteraeota bacterium]
MGVDLARRILEHDARALARGITLVENGSPSAASLTAALYPHTGHAHVIGVTGPPGSGKSTLVDALTAAVRNDSRSVGIIAVDPSSPFTGGAVLGDRVRMQRHSGDAGVFIRSMASRRNPGGLAPTTRDVARTLDAFGCDVILIETVGVGQVELGIMKVADTVLVVTVPGLGDGVQTIKAGLVEIADCFIINMADRPGVQQAVGDLKTMLTLGGAEERRRRWNPPVLETIATNGTGVPAVWEACQRHERVLATDNRMGRSHDRLRDEVVEEVQRRVGAYVGEELSRNGSMEPVLAAVMRRELDPTAAAASIVRERLTRPN